MTAQEFVDAIHQVVAAQAVEDTFSLVENPPGRKPDPDLIKLSSWFKTLSVVDKQHLQSLVKLTSDLSLFGFLAVLDGVRAIEDGPTKGRLKLYHQCGDQTKLINDPSGPFLHDLIKDMED